MTAAWIQVFILTFAECVAPAGKTVCQEQQFELQFLDRADCEYALSQLIAMKSESNNVIVNHQKSGCVPSAAKSEAYESLEAINEAHKDIANWRMASENDVGGVRVDKQHQERLKTLMSCEETANVAPCKIGDIIIEDEIDGSVEVWKSD
jgi:hypothetical protein